MIFIDCTNHGLDRDLKRFVHLATWALTGGKGSSDVDYSDPETWMDALVNGDVDRFVDDSSDGILIEIDPSAWTDFFKLPEGDWGHWREVQEWWLEYLSAFRRRWPQKNISVWNYAQYTFPAIAHGPLDERDYIKYHGWYGAGSFVPGAAGMDMNIYAAYLSDRIYDWDGLEMWFRLYDARLELAERQGITPVPTIWPHAGFDRYLNGSEMGAVLGHIQSSDVEYCGIWEHNKFLKPSYPSYEPLDWNEDCMVVLQEFMDG